MTVKITNGTNEIVDKITVMNARVAKRMTKIMVDQDIGYYAKTYVEDLTEALDVQGALLRRIVELEDWVYK